MTDDNDFALSRRTVLAGMGTIGVAGAAAGFGTSAYFSDTETFENNSLVAGSLDLKVDWQQTYTGPNGDVPINAYPDHDGDGWQSLDDGTEYAPGSPITLACSDLESGDGLPEDVFAAPNRTTDNGGPIEEQGSLIVLDDVKPGDSGEVTFSLHLCDNPGYLWLNGQVLENAENGFTEPEATDPDESGAPSFDLTFDSADDATLVQDGNPITSEVDDDGNAAEPEWPDPSTVEGPYWLVDRWAPDGFSVGDVESESALCISVDEDGPDKDYPDDTFYDYHGVKYVTGTGNGYWNAGDGSTVSTRFYVDPDWEGDGDNQTTGVWIQGGDELENVTVYSILEYRDSDAAADDDHPSEEPGFYVYGQTSPGTYEYVYAGLPSGFDPASGGWVDIEYELDAGTAHRWRVNGEELYADEAAAYDGTTRIQVPFINSLNFGTDQQYCYDDFALERTGTGLGELADAISATLWYDDDCDNERDEGEEIIFEGSLATALGALTANDGRGLPLDGDRSSTFDETQDDESAAGRDCFDADTQHCIGFEWELPIDHANEIQTDSLAFDLGFYTEQCRHNDGSGMPPETVSTPSEDSE
ncbi:SipW-dependent-type signal peptide-containing protein [Halapricum desulfuricans]|nr:SipW-dependent-type signal peptide-containing protein [Halapricum desulfuricans]